MKVHKIRRKESATLFWNTFYKCNEISLTVMRRDETVVGFNSFYGQIEIVHIKIEFQDCAWTPCKFYIHFLAFLLVLKPLGHRTKAMSRPLIKHIVSSQILTWAGSRESKGTNLATEQHKVLNVTLLTYNKLQVYLQPDIFWFACVSC